MPGTRRYLSRYGRKPAKAPTSAHNDDRADPDQPRKSLQIRPIPSGQPAGYSPQSGSVRRKDGGNFVEGLPRRPSDPQSGNVIRITLVFGRPNQRLDSLSRVIPIRS